MTAKEVLEFVLTKGVPMVAVYWILDRPFLKKWLASIEGFLVGQLGISVSIAKRVLAFLLSFGLSVGIFSIYAGLGYADFPNTFETWADLVIRLGTVVFAGSQVIHARDMR